MRWVVLAGLVLVLVASAQAAGVRLDWDYTQASSPATKFRVYRQAGCTGVFTPLTPDVQPVSATPASYTYTDSTLVAGQSYCYQATALNAAGTESTPSNGVTFQLPGVVAAPVNLRGTLVP